LLPRRSEKPLPPMPLKLSGIRADEDPD